MTTLSTLPIYPPPGRQVTVSFALTESGSNYVRVWCTSAPPGSELREQLDGTTDPRNRVIFYEGDGGRPKSASFSKGGKYTLVAQEYTKNASTFGGGYQGDPDGAPSETAVGSETSLSLYVGQRFKSIIRAGADQVTLVVWVWNDKIQRTTIAVHGEETPALQAASPTPRAQAAMESAAVIALVDALAGATHSAAVGDPNTVLGDAGGGFLKEWNDHLVETTIHQNDDTDNALTPGLASAASAGNLADKVNEMLRFVRQHYTNDAVEAGTDSGRDSGAYHVKTGSNVNDNANLPLIQSASGPQDAYWACADLHRSYEAHRLSSAAHNTTDGVNVLSALPSLMAVGSAIFTVWASTTPTTPATQSDAAMALISRAGFDESPLES